MRDGIFKLVYSYTNIDIMKLCSCITLSNYPIWNSILEKKNASVTGYAISNYLFSKNNLNFPETKNLFISTPGITYQNLHVGC